MESSNKNKIRRILTIYTKLMEGQVVKKGEEAACFNVNERSIQRDIDDIRGYFEQETVEHGLYYEVIYDREKNGYILDHVNRTKLTNQEILAICKILLDSRALRKNEMMSILESLIKCCVPVDNQKQVRDLISNESYHYIELSHKKSVLNHMWTLGQAIHTNHMIEIEYQGMKDSNLKMRKLKPLAIMFSEYYFYLTAFIEDESVKEHLCGHNRPYPTIYRIDRIHSIKVLDKTFHIPYTDRFEEGEFRKRIQFMYGGELRKVKFEYSGMCVEAILDRLPTAKILSEQDGKYVIQAEVYGDGIDMWLRSQGSKVRLLQ